MCENSPRRPVTVPSLHLSGVFVVAVLLVFPASPPRAVEIYKSVDANGNVTYSDHADPSMPQTTVVHLEDPRYPPHEIHFCWTNCFTLILDSGIYRRADGSGETWTVETFTAQSVVLHRHGVPADWNGFNTDVTYAGQAANDRWMGVTVNGKPAKGIDASWGIALNTLPGSNAERDAHDSAPPPADEPAADAAVSTVVAPPPLRNDDQPVDPQEGYLWTPGYWYWGGQGYFWISGAWVRPPRVGVLWTPGYWGFADGAYVFHPGYWGSRIGFYGGVNYGNGYFGSGYSGGRWMGTSFAYNRSTNHLNPDIAHTAYEEPLPPRAAGSRVSYTGGPGGVTAVPTAQEMSAAAETHIPATGPHRQAIERFVSKPTPPNAAEPRSVPNTVIPKSAVADPPAVEGMKAVANTPPVERRSTPAPSQNGGASAPKSNRVPSIKASPRQ